MAPAAGLPAIRRLFQCPLDDGGDRNWQFWEEQADVRGWDMTDGLGRCKDVVTDFEGWSAGKHSKRDDTKRMDIRPRGNRPERWVDLFRSHVRGRSDARIIFPTEADVGRRVRNELRELGNSEVDDMDISVRIDDEISGLQIPMNDSGGVDTAHDVAGLKQKTHRCV